MMFFKNLKMPTNRGEIITALFLLEVIAFLKAFCHGGIYISIWTFSYWLISYDLGFIKRGLLGTLLSPLSERLGHSEAVILVSIISIILLSIIIILLGVYIIEKLNSSFLGWFIVISFIMLPSGLGNFYLGFSRHDIIMIILTISSTILALNTKAKRINFLLLPIIYISGILIREIYIFIGMPVFCFLIAKRTKRPEIYLPIFILLNFLIIFTLFLYGGSDLSADQLSLVLQEIGAKKDFLFNNEQKREFLPQFTFIYTNSLYDNFLFFITERGDLINYLSSIVTIVPLFLIASTLKKIVSSQERKWLYFSIAIPLLLGLVAIDMGRWVSLSTINFFMILGCIIHFNPKIFHNPRINLCHMKSYIVLSSFISISGIVTSPTVFLMLRLFKK